MSSGAAEPDGMDIPAMHQSNRAAWNEAAEKYESDVEADIAFLRAGGKNLMDVELPFLEGLSDWCGRAVHLQCAGGRDTLSLWNHGAREVVGIDISERMIACARRKSEALGAPALWHCGDVLETPSSFDGTADLVYTGRGALCWILDREAWAAVVARLLKPGGRLYVFDGHPLSWVWDMAADTLRLDPAYGDYFQETIQSDQGWGYWLGDLSVPDARQARKYERQHTLGDLVTTLARTGLRLEALKEHPDLYWDQFPHLPAGTVARLPHTFSLAMRKE